MVLIILFNSSDPNHISEEMKDVEVTPITSIDEFSVPYADGVRYTITSPYGMRVDPISFVVRLHDGVDTTAPLGTDIVASASGKVYRAGYYENGLGYQVFLEHSIDGKTYYTAYGHMAKDSIVVHTGQIVGKKQKLGKIGSSGYATGVHLHFMIMKDEPKFTTKYLIDPYFVFKKDKKGSE